jgi:hypothetical protein
MRARLTSYRFRRRALTTLVVAGVFGAIVIGAITVGNTGRKAAPPDKRPVWTYKAPRHQHLTKQDRQTLFAVSNTFVTLAVARPPTDKLPPVAAKKLDVAWDLLGPEMRAGQTRKDWDSGFNNVVPFKADGIQRWSIDYAYRDDVGIDLSLVSGRGAKWAGKTFTIELKRYPQRGNRWLVAAWVPKGVGGGGTLDPNRGTEPPAAEKAKVATKWLLLPIAIFCLLLLSLAGLGGGRMLAQRRAARRYAETLGYGRAPRPS